MVSEFKIKRHLFNSFKCVWLLKMIIMGHLTTQRRISPYVYRWNTVIILTLNYLVHANFRLWKCYDRETQYNAILVKNSSSPLWRDLLEWTTDKYSPKGTSMRVPADKRSLRKPTPQSAESVACRRPYVWKIKNKKCKNSRM